MNRGGRAGWRTREVSGADVATRLDAAVNDLSRKKFIAQLSRWSPVAAHAISMRRLSRSSSRKRVLHRKRKAINGRSRACRDKRRQENHCTGKIRLEIFALRWNRRASNFRLDASCRRGRASTSRENALLRDAKNHLTPLAKSRSSLFEIDRIKCVQVGAKLMQWSGSQRAASRSMRASGTKFFGCLLDCTTALDHDAFRSDRPERI